MGHVPHVFVPPPWPDGDLPVGERTDHHLRKVLRRRPGDPVSYTDGAGAAGTGTLTGAGIGRGDETVAPRPAPAVTLAVAPPARAERARFVVEKAAELGIDRLVWLATTHSEGRAPAAAKAAAWAVGALEQSRGAFLMAVDGPEPASALPSPLWVADPSGGAPPLLTAPVAVLVGPEGGFAPGEVPGAALPISLGGRILRVETAALAAAVLALQAAGRWPVPGGGTGRNPA